MKRIVGVLGAAALFFSGDLSAAETRPASPPAGVILRLDLKNPKDLKLANFRGSEDPFKENLPPYPVRIGLEKLQTSGSAQFTPQGLKQLQEKLKGKNWIDVDLRQESHGYMNDLPVSWYGEHDWANKGKTLPQIEKDERERLQEGLKLVDVTATVIKTVKEILEEFPFPIAVTSVFTERELIESSAVKYHRIPATDHVRPADEIVDQFLVFQKSLPADTWLHFHCEAGEGRTTTFLVMLDILKNAPHVAFIDLVKRQWILGGVDLSKFPPESDWKYPYEVERYEFLKKFYTYVKSGAPESWSQWLTSQQGASPKKAKKKK